MPQKQEQLQEFFETLLLDMVEHSPAIADLHPLLKNAFFSTLKKGTVEAKQAILKTLLKETHEYAAVAQKLQKKYGIDPEEYIRRLEKWVQKDIAAGVSAHEQVSAESGAVLAFDHL